MSSNEEEYLATLSKNYFEKEKLTPIIPFESVVSVVEQSLGDSTSNVKTSSRKEYEEENVSSNEKEVSTCHILIDSTSRKYLEESTSGRVFK